MRQKIQRMILAALFAALSCVATLVVQIPAPMGGFLHLGDCFVLLSGWLLGPFYGFFAAAIGSALADVFSGYGVYAPATFIIKGAVALFAVLPLRLPVFQKRARLGRLTGAVTGELFMVDGYFLYAVLMFGEKVIAAAASIPGNLLQGAVGLVAAAMLYEAIKKTGIVEKYFYNGVLPWKT